MVNTRVIKVGKAGSSTVNVEIPCNAAMTYNDVIAKAGFDVEVVTRIVTHAGTVLGEAALGDDVTTIILSAPKIEAGAAYNVVLTRGLDYEFWEVAEEAGFKEDNYFNFKTVDGSFDDYDVVDEKIDMIIFEDTYSTTHVINVGWIDAPVEEPEPVALTGRKIKVGKAGSTAKIIEIGCTEAVTYNMLIEKAGFDVTNVTRIVTHAGPVLGDSAVADDVTTIILSAPKIEAGSTPVFVIKPGTTYKGAIAATGATTENILRIIGDEGELFPEDEVPDDCTVFFKVIYSNFEIADVAVRVEEEKIEETTTTNVGETTMTMKTIKVGKAGSTTVNVEVGCREALTYNMVIDRAGFDVGAVTRIVTHAGAVLGDSVLGDDVTTIILSAPKIEAGSCPRTIKVGKAGSSTVAVEVKMNEALTYADVISRAGFDTSSVTRVVTHAGAVLMESALADDVTTIILSAPKIEAGSCPRTIKVGKAGSSTVVVEVGGDEVMTYGDLIKRAGFDTETVTRIVTHSGAVLMESALADDVTTVILSAPKIEAGI